MFYEAIDDGLFTISKKNDFKDYIAHNKIKTGDQKKALKHFEETLFSFFLQKPKCRTTLFYVSFRHLNALDSQHRVRRVILTVSSKEEIGFELWGGSGRSLNILSVGSSE